MAVVAGGAHPAGAQSHGLVACKSGSVRAVVDHTRVCLRVGGKCKARYERVYEQKGFRCVAGRLQKKQKPVPPPPPAPPPAALEGHYLFTTNQGNAGTVDVLTGGHSFANFVIPYRAECSDGGHYISILSTMKDVTVQLDSNLSFSTTAQLTNTDGSFNVNAGIKFDTAGAVSGSLTVTLTRSAGGTCTTPAITFSGNLRPPSYIDGTNLRLVSFGQLPRADAAAALTSAVEFAF